MVNHNLCVDKNTFVSRMLTFFCYLYRSFFSSISDINECEDEDNRCQYGGTCVNVVGTFRCLCNPGFVSDKSGRECTGVYTLRKFVVNELFILLF